jgi:peptide/nickel transport system permease protein
MVAYALRRALLGLAVVFTASVLAFVLVRVSGDVATMLAGADATETDVEVIRTALGLDQPLAMQYARWAIAAIRGEFGDSLVFPVPVMQLLLERAPVTFALAFASLCLALVVAIPLGIAAAVWPGSLIDRFAQTLAALGQAAPTFFIALLLIAWLGVSLRVLPIAGSSTPAHFILPSVVLALHIMPAFIRMTRTTLIEVLASDYVRTAHAKGLPPAVVVLKHGLRNAVLPIVSLAAVQLGGLLEGAVVVETIFALDGIGMLAWQSVGRLDFMVIQAIVFWSSLVYVVLTLLADLANAYLNPRLRLS